MIEFMPEDVVENLARARQAKLAKRTRLRVQVGDDLIPLTRLTPTHFAIDRAQAPRLRGLVDIYDGARHLCQALVVATSFDGDDVVFSFKRNTAAATGPALDFERVVDAPVGLLPAH